MDLGVAEISMVSPLGLTASEHVFFWRAEVTPNASGAFTTREGEALPISDCAWIPATRPPESRLRLLARQALAGVRGPPSSRAPILLIAPAGASQSELARFLKLSGFAVEAIHTGSAGVVSALRQSQEMLATHAEVVVLAVDTLLSREDIEAWLDTRYSSFTRNPLPPSEGAAAVRIVRDTHQPLAGKVYALASAQSEATDANDLPADGALSRVFADLGLPGAVPLVVGPSDVDPLRMRDYHVAAVRHCRALERAETPSLEGRIGLLGSAAGLMSTVFALAWLRHGLELPAAQSKPRALSWARSPDGQVSAALVGGERS
jgi:hypothetical protein